jgi:hypothetical protein
MWVRFTFAAALAGAVLLAANHVYLERVWLNRHGPFRFILDAGGAGTNSRRRHPAFDRRDTRSTDNDGTAA